MHQCPACLTNISPDSLWNKNVKNVAEGQNSRWTLARCNSSEKAEETILEEGARFSVHSTAVERNPIARKKCLEYYGYSCSACDLKMEDKYGELGKKYIHVHHRNDLAKTNGSHVVDPIKDLIPLCPNCHAMVHKEKPAMTIEKLKKILVEYG